MSGELMSKFIANKKLRKRSFLFTMKAVFRKNPRLEARMFLYPVLEDKCPVNTRWVPKPQSEDCKHIRLPKKSYSGTCYPKQGTLSISQPTPLSTAISIKNGGLSGRINAFSP